MNTEWKRTLQSLQLLPGDRIIIPKSSLGFIKHHAIFLNRFMDNYYFIENKVGEGVRIVSADILFADIEELIEVVRFTGNDRGRRAAIQKAKSLVGKSYDLLNFNCEHYSNVVQYNVCESKQVNWGVLIGFTAVLVLLVRNTN